MYTHIHILNVYIYIYIYVYTHIHMYTFSGISMPSEEYAAFNTMLADKPSAPRMAR